MPEKSFEARLADVERKQAKLENMLKSLGLDDDFQPLPVAAKILKITPNVIYKRYRKPGSELNKHYKLKGNRILISVSQWKKLIAADAAAKLA